MTKKSVSKNFVFKNFLEYWYFARPLSGFQRNIGQIGANESINRSNALTGTLSNLSQGVGAGMFNNLFSSSGGIPAANVGSGGANPNTVGFGSPF